jgi:hypothetical protein
MTSRVQDVLFASLERAMRERAWKCPRCESAAHPAPHARDIVLRCSNSECSHIHQISDQTLTVALREAEVRCPRCHSYLRPDRRNHRVVCWKYPACTHRESWASLLLCRASSRADTTSMSPYAGVRVQNTRPRAARPAGPTVNRPGLSMSVIVNTVDLVRQKQQSDLVQNHHFQVRVAIQEIGSSWKTMVAVVPPTERGSGILVDVRALVFFDRSAAQEDIRSRLREWAQPRL